VSHLCVNTLPASWQSVYTQMENLRKVKLNCSRTSSVSAAVLLVPVSLSSSCPERTDTLF